MNKKQNNKVNVVSDVLDDMISGAAVFEPRSTYDEAILGITDNDEGETVAVYGYNALVRTLMKHDKMSEEDAIDWIEYNTIRSLPYMGKRRPVIIKEIEWK